MGSLTCEKTGASYTSARHLVINYGTSEYIQQFLKPSKNRCMFVQMTTKSEIRCCNMMPNKKHTNLGITKKENSIYYHHQHISRAVWRSQCYSMGKRRGLIICSHLIRLSFTPMIWACAGGASTVMLRVNRSQWVSTNPPSLGMTWFNSSEQNYISSVSDSNTKWAGVYITSCSAPSLFVDPCLGIGVTSTVSIFQNICPVHSFFYW